MLRNLLEMGPCARHESRTMLGRPAAGDQRHERPEVPQWWSLSCQWRCRRRWEVRLLRKSKTGRLRGRLEPGLRSSAPTPRTVPRSTGGRACPITDAGTVSVRCPETNNPVGQLLRSGRAPRSARESQRRISGTRLLSCMLLSCMDACGSRYTARVEPRRPRRGALVPVRQ